MKKDSKDIYSTNIKWFEKTYMNLVESRKYRGTKKKRGDGFNKHHILPKCLGGKDENSIKKINYCFSFIIFSLNL